MADELKIGDVAGIVTQMLEDDRQKMGLFNKIDEATACIFEPDAAIKNLPWVQNRHFGMTDIADSVNTGVRTFSTLMPQIEIAPLNDEQAEYERTDRAEKAWTWEFEKMNHVGKKSIHEQIMEDGMRYHAVALQTEYLPYKFKGRAKDGRIKSLLRSRCFNWIRHHPGTVHSRESDYGVEAVAKVSSYSVQNLVENFGADNPGVIKLMAKHSGAKKEELLRIKYILVDYVDWKHRTQFALAQPSNSIPTVIGESDVVFMNEEHGLPFIPWVVVDKGDPIWKSVLQSGLWDNMQYLNLIRFAKSIETATRPDLMFWTPDGSLKNIWLDSSSPTAVAAGLLDGSRMENIPPKTIDPQLETIFQEMAGKTASSTVSSVLRDVGRFANTPFASVNQMINMALGQLARAKNAAGDAEALAIYQGFEWISHSGIPFTAYRPKTSDSKIEEAAYNGKGGQIIISPDAAPGIEKIQAMSEQEQALLSKTVFYDLEALYIKVNLQSNNAADEQSRLNVNINAIDKLGMSREYAWERMGWENYQLVSNQKRGEMLEDAELQKESQLIMLEVEKAKMQMQMQAQAMQAQQAAQQQQAQEQQQAMQQQQAQQAQINQQSGGAQPTTQGMDMRMGGNPQAMANPQGTREMLTGQSRNGGQVQR